MRISAIQVLNGLRQVSENSDNPSALKVVEKVNAVMDKVRATETNGMILNMIGG